MSDTTITATDKAPSIYDIFSCEQRDGFHPVNLTIGNPNLKPPALYYEVMHQVIQELERSEWNGHGYIVGKDPFGLCKKIATKLTCDFNIPFEGQDVCITVGATNAIDIILKTILENKNQQSSTNTQNEVIIIAPYFVEYVNLIQSNGGKAVIVYSNSEYGIDLTSIERSITPFTKALIINSPNNPTGKVYSEEELIRLSTILKKKNDEFDIHINIIEDAVYDIIVFGTMLASSLIPHYPFLFRVNSYSKSMSLSGERIGYLAMHPNSGNDECRNQLRSALHLNMRMRVVHAPLLQHRIIARLPDNCVTDINYYKRNIETLYNCLFKLGFKVSKPEGTFYLWATLPDHYNGEKEFRIKAQQGNSPLLYLPGFFFGGDAYNNCIRFSACVSFEVISRACERLKEIDTCFSTI